MRPDLVGEPLPGRWPSAWPHLYRPLAERAAFVLVVMVLTTIGLILLGDPGQQWWVVAVPLVLLTGPATLPARTRRAIQHATDHGRARVITGRITAVERRGRAWLTPADASTGLPLDAAAASRALHRHAGAPTRLVVAGRRRAAIVLPGLTVVYLRRAPAGAASTPATAAPAGGAAVGRTLPTH